MLFGFEGVKRASRYKLVGDNPDQAKYLAVYEFDTKEDWEAFPKSPAFADAVKDFEDRKDELGFDMKWGCTWELITTMERK